jgi:hypothetical protein
MKHRYIPCTHSVDFERVPYSKCPNCKQYRVTRLKGAKYKGFLWLVKDGYQYSREFCKNCWWEAKQ